MANSSQSSNNTSSSTSSKHLKLSSEEKSNDWISKLPDSVLCHILSYVPTKTGAATSILSKRWQFLWTFMPNIDLDVFALVRDGVNMSFGDIVDRTLISRRKDCCIKRFQLKGHRKDENHYETCISEAIERNVEELDFQLGCNSVCFEIPSGLFYSRTLVVLKLLGGNIMMNAPSSIHLPSLKVLVVWFVQYKDDQSIRNLLAGCPVLEELDVARFNDDNILDYEITAPSLRSLKIMYLELVRRIQDSLARFNRVHLKNLCNLVEAKISVYPFDDLLLEHYENSVDVLQAVYNVKFLELSWKTMRALRYDHRVNFPAFNNLVRLKLDGFCCFWGLLLKLLKNSPYLEHLYLSKPSAYRIRDCGCRDSERWMQPEIVPMCLSSHLTTFCFVNVIIGLGDDIEFVGYILENSLVLEDMTIRCSDELDCNEMFDVEQEIEMFRKGSEKCQIIYL